jgi:hypothetical protein
MYLPLKEGQRNLTKFFVEMFELVRGGRREPSGGDGMVGSRLSMIEYTYLTLGRKVRVSIPRMLIPNRTIARGLVEEFN